MKLKIYKKDCVKVENEKRTYSNYEFDDGIHFSGNASVYHDREGKKPAQIVFFEGRMAPLGELQSPGRGGTIDRNWHNMDVIKETGGTPTVSRAWKRHMAEIMDAVGKYIPIIVIVALVIYAIAANGGI